MEHDIMEVMRERHSVRRYSDRPVEQDRIDRLRAAADGIPRDKGIRIGVVTGEKGVFGLFGCDSYIYIAVTDGSDEDVGRYGEMLVLLAQDMGLRTCWAGVSYRRDLAAKHLLPGEKLRISIALGYAAGNGHPHRSKSMEKLADMRGDMPDWFLRGMEAAMLAPTAVNQQCFRFGLTEEGKVWARATPALFPYAKLDLGIAKYHFECGAGRDSFEWA